MTTAIVRLYRCWFAYLSLCVCLVNSVWLWSQPLRPQPFRSLSLFEFLAYGSLTGEYSTDDSKIAILGLSEPMIPSSNTSSPPRKRESLESFTGYQPHIIKPSDISWLAVLFILVGRWGEYEPAFVYRCLQALLRESFDVHPTS